MEDRELLEAAAKAVGIAIVGPVEKFIVQFEDRHKGGFIVRNERGGDSCWNPLTDDGDALRLAVALRIDVWFLGHNAVQVAGGEHPITTEAICVETDPAAATRRAIVRAAAVMAGAPAA